MNAWFLIFVAAVILSIIAGMLRYLPDKYRAPGLLAFAAWIAYGGMMGYLGVIGNAAMMPPGMAYLLIPGMLFVIFMASSRIGMTIAASIPLWFLAGMESFRIVVEYFLHQLWLAGMIPRMLTYQGANFDIATALSAPIVAWMLASNRLSERTALVWNVLGIAMLANVAVRGVLTSPGPLHWISTTVPNTAIGTFPYTYIPGLMVPLALVMHVLSIRALRSRMRNSAVPVPARQNF